MAAEQLAELYSKIQSGAEVAIENVETFAPDVVIPGAGELLGKTETVTLGNGTAAEVSQLVTETSATTATTAGVGLLALEMPNAIAAAVPFLGCFAGMTLYNLAPEFWTSVADNLMQAGETIGGKVRAFVNSSTGQVGFTENTLNIIKNALIDAGLYDMEMTYPDNYPANPKSYNQVYQLPLTLIPSMSAVMRFSNEGPNSQYFFVRYTGDAKVVCVKTYVDGDNDMHYGLYGFSKSPFTWKDAYCDANGNPSPAYNPNAWNTMYNAAHYQRNGLDYYAFYDTKYVRNSYWSSNVLSYMLPEAKYSYNIILDDLAQILLDGLKPNPAMQPDAVYPTADEPISTTYPNLTPWQLPQELPTIYPIEVPVNNPNPTQQEAQNPDTEPEPAPFLDWLLQVLPQPEPNPNPQPEPVPEPDPDPQPEPEPLPVIDPVEIDPNPVDPNQPVQPSPLPITPDLPTTVDSNAMFTVYAPSISQLNAFGGWLWSNNIIDMLLRIWQNPLEGIIAFQKVYAVPTVGTSSNIIVGYVDSQVSAPVVTSQFVTVNCGTITVDEILNNATDYPPYTMMHIYLPFIGIVELDCNEFMNGSITVTYHIDVYTGTCLVEVASTRSPDMANPTIIYTFSGNASQQLPLTSSNFGGALNALVSTVSGVARMGSGGSLNAISGLSTIGHSVSHEMIHIAHSGDLSANAGIMALRTPYLIIGRRNSYDANAYNELYGYPANKTVYLGNCSGFTRVKAGFLRSKATEEEKQEIMDLLKKGVIL